MTFTRGVVCQQHVTHSKLTCRPVASFDFNRAFEVDHKLSLWGAVIVVHIFFAFRARKSEKVEWLTNESLMMPSGGPRLALGISRSSKYERPSSPVKILVTFITNPDSLASICVFVQTLQLGVWRNSWSGRDGVWRITQRNVVELSGKQRCDMNSQRVGPIGCGWAPVAELADAPALGAGVSRRVGSSPTRRTNSN